MAFCGSYGSVMRYVRKLRESQPVEARVVIETAPGPEAQVDYAPRSRWCAIPTRGSTGEPGCSF
jgi:hypothetical protein